MAILLVQVREGVSLQSVLLDKRQRFTAASAAPSSPEKKDLSAKLQSLWNRTAPAGADETGEDDA
jgi:hypothetical protein